MPTTPTHVLVTPVSEGGELVFAHALDSGIRVWMRGLTGPVDERPRRLRGVAAPLYGGTIRDLVPLPASPRHAPTGTANARTGVWDRQGEQCAAAR